MLLCNPLEVKSYVQQELIKRVSFGLVSQYELQSYG